MTIAFTIIGATIVFWIGFLWGYMQSSREDLSRQERAYLKGWDAACNIARWNATAAMIPPPARPVGVRYSKN